MRFLTSMSFVIVIGVSAFGQLLPDRDELVQKFLAESTSVEASRELIKHFQKGGLRTIIRNINELPPHQRIRYGEVLRHMDLMTFRNDLSANMENAPDDDSRAMFLMLLATVGRALDQSIFQKYVDDQTAPVKVRLAAASGIIKIQKPSLYDQFHEIADTADIDPTTGQDDFVYADIHKSNVGFYLYTRSQLDQDKMSHGVIITALVMAENDSVDIYNKILDEKKRKYIPLMIDRAVKVGGVQLLEAMSDHKTCKKSLDEIQKGLAAAKFIAQYRNMFMDKLEKSNEPIGPLLPLFCPGQGAEEGFRPGYAVVKVSAEGDISLLYNGNPFGGSSDFENALRGHTVPAYMDWKPVESYALVLAK